MYVTCTRMRVTASNTLSDVFKHHASLAELRSWARFNNMEFVDAPAMYPRFTAERTDGTPLNENERAQVATECSKLQRWIRGDRVDAEYMFPAALLEAE